MVQYDEGARRYGKSRNNKQIAAVGKSGLRNGRGELVGCVGN